MDATKIRLSQEEASLVLRGDWILTKNSVMQKTMHMLGAVQTAQKALLSAIENPLPPDILQSSPKISRGENYLGLPWLMLDYPRLFNKEDSFAIRTFFWWGNFFSVTLQVSGTYKKYYAASIESSFRSLQAGGFFACINEDPWQHHFGPDNYQSFSTMTIDEWKEILSRGDFIKISKIISLQEWNDAQKKLVEVFRKLVHAVTG